MIKLQKYLIIIYFQSTIISIPDNLLFWSFWNNKIKYSDLSIVDLLII